MTENQEIPHRPRSAIGSLGHCVRGGCSRRDLLASTPRLVSVSDLVRVDDRLPAVVSFRVNPFPFTLKPHFLAFKFALNSPPSFLLPSVRGIFFNTPTVVNVLRIGCMAGFQVILHGRSWVFTEVNRRGGLASTSPYVGHFWFRSTFGRPHRSYLRLPRNGPIIARLNIPI